MNIIKVKGITCLPDPIKEIKDRIYEECKIKEQNFYKGIIRNSTFINCDLSECNFSKATISNCKFINCFMQYSSMLRVSINNCEFCKCDFWHSNMCHSKVHNTIFTECNIRALFKELDWIGNVFDRDTIIESCGGTRCIISQDIIEKLLELSKRNAEALNG